MNYVENEIKKAIKSEITKPQGYEIAIKSAFEKKKMKEKNALLKIATTVTCLILGGTVVIATNYKVNEKKNIWKEPEKVDVSNYSKKEITNKSAEDILKEYIKVIGYDNIPQTILELRDSFDSTNLGSKYYYLRTNEDYNKGITLTADELTLEIDDFENKDFDNTYTKFDFIEKEQAIEKAKELLTKLNIFENKYSVVRIEEENNIYFIRFGQKNDNGIINKYDVFSINFGMINNQMIVKRISVFKNDTYQNNEIIITEEEAKEIASKKNAELFGDREVKKVTCELGIERMNDLVYKLEKGELGTGKFNPENNYIYKIDDIIRNVWIVRFSYVELWSDRLYYVDTTTGEIIGGRPEMPIE